MIKKLLSRFFSQKGPGSQSLRPGFFTLVLAFLARILPASAQVPAAVSALVPADGFGAEQLGTLVEKIKDFPNGTRVSLARLEGDKVTFYGIERRNDTLYPVSLENMAFSAGSITKVFTATALAKQVLEGKMALPDRVDDRSGLAVKGSPPITFLHLANHTAGLPRLAGDMFWHMMQNPDNPYASYSGENLEQYLANDCKLESSPGERYAYSNLGAGLLGYILAKIAGISYSDLLTNTVFEPYGMEHSATHPEALGGEVAEGLDTLGRPVPAWTFQDAQAGAGAVFTTASDLSRFLAAHLRNTDKVLALTREPTFKVNDRMEIALGWHVLHMKNGSTLHWHNGAAGGYTASMALNMEKNTGTVVLTNISAFHKKMGKVDEICFEMAQ